MIYRKSKLARQLLWLVGIAFMVLFLSLGVVLPKILVPVLETNIYRYLSEPLKVIDNDFDKKLLNTEVAYIYVLDNEIKTSDNLTSVIKITDIKKIVAKMTSSHGKVIYNNKTYYYYVLNSEHMKKIALSNDTYVNKIKTSILSAIFPIVLGTFLLIGLILVLWSSIVVRKIDKLKNKIDNIDNPDFNHKIDFETDDEIRSLALAIEDMRISLINQEKYRNQMYQNISHDFKTPLTVIKSYIEAVEDNVETPQNALKVVKQQTEKLEQKVHSLLYLNKLDYLKNLNIEIVPVDMASIINEEVNKFKFVRDLNYIVDIDKKSKYFGTKEHWETIFDNILSNFCRYAKTTIKITAKQNKIILFNDGEKIADDLLEGIFTPFRKGIKGEFGLGLSIVKKTLNLIGYDIIIKNQKRGVVFIITKEVR